jgi:hypothetical protein
MKRTTLALDDRLYERIREISRIEGRQIQECANDLLAAGLAARSRRQPAAEPLPVFSMGEARVDLADREALLDVLDRE